MSDGLLAFLRARLDEEQAEANKLDDTDDWWVTGSWVIRREETGTYDSYAYLRIAKARVLAEVEAKRKLITRVLAYEATVDGEWGCCHDADEIAAGVCETHPDGIDALQLLALPYADHPDYRTDWRP